MTVAVRQYPSAEPRDRPPPLLQASGCSEDVRVGHPQRARQHQKRHQGSRFVLSGRLAHRAMSQYATSPAPANGAAQTRPLSKSKVRRPVPVARSIAAGAPKLNTEAKNPGAKPARNTGALWVGSQLGTTNLAWKFQARLGTTRRGRAGRCGPGAGLGLRCPGLFEFAPAASDRCASGARTRRGDRRSRRRALRRDRPDPRIVDGVPMK